MECTQESGCCHCVCTQCFLLCQKWTFTCTYCTGCRLQYIELSAYFITILILKNSKPRFMWYGYYSWTDPRMRNPRNYSILWKKNITGHHAHKNSAWVARKEEPCEFSCVLSCAKIVLNTSPASGKVRVSVFCRSRLVHWNWRRPAVIWNWAQKSLLHFLFPKIFNFTSRQHTNFSVPVLYCVRPDRRGSGNDVINV